MKLETKRNCIATMQMPPVRGRELKLTGGECLPVGEDAPCAGARIETGQFAPKHLMPSMRGKELKYRILFRIVEKIPHTHGEKITTSPQKEG